MDMITLLPSLFLSLPSFLLSFLPLFSLPPSLGWPRRPRREREVREEEGREKEERRTRKKTRTHTRRRARREGRRDGREREEGKTGGGERAERGVGKKDAEAARKGGEAKKIYYTLNMLGVRRACLRAGAGTVPRIRLSGGVWRSGDQK
jgi:hypothetical protein